MNPKRLMLAIVAVFIGVAATNFLIHQVWLMSTYNATASLWRPQAEFMSHMGWLMLGQLLRVVMFVVLYAKGFADKACIRCAVMFGLLMGVFFEANTLIVYATQPLPGELAVKWFLANVTQSVLMGLIVFFTYKPVPGDGKGEGCEAKA
jgi:hypothetical protein